MPDCVKAEEGTRIRSAIVITSAEDCLRHIAGSIPSHDFELAVLYIELFVAETCHDAVLKTIEEQHEAAQKIIATVFGPVAL